MLRIAFFVFSLFIIQGVNLAYSQDNICQQRQCVAIVDAGSTGSRLFVYAYDLDSHHYPIKIDTIFSKKVKPGVSSLEYKQEVIDAYLNNLFDHGVAKNVPLFFYATGGMRLEPEARQKQFFQLIKQWGDKQTQWQLLDAKIITGKDEGTYGWLANNFAHDAFTHNNALLGLMDIGGASVELSFPVAEKANLNPDDLVSIDIYGRHITLFVHSFLGLGVTEVTKKFQNIAHCFPNGYPLQDNQVGHGDATRCYQHISKSLNLTQEVNDIINKAMQSNETQVWYAFGALAELAKSKPLMLEKDQFTPLELLKQANNKICTHEWSNLKANYPGDEYLAVGCLTASYLYGLVVDGWGISVNQIINHNALQDINWTLGVILYQSQLV